MSGTRRREEGLALKIERTRQALGVVVLAGVSFGSEVAERTYVPFIHFGRQHTRSFTPKCRMLRSGFEILARAAR